MKKILVALLTFTVGVVAFNLLKTRQISPPTTFTLEQKSVEISETAIENTLTEISENSKPFFDSFEGKRI